MEHHSAFEAALASQGLTRRVGVTVPDTYSAIAVVLRSDMAVAVPRRVAENSAMSGRFKLIERELSDRFEQAETGLVVVERLADQALVDQRAHQIEDVWDGVLGAGCWVLDGRVMVHSPRTWNPEPRTLNEGFDGFKGAAADEDAEQSEDPAFVVAEQAVAPADRVAKGPLAGRQVAWAVGQDR